MKNLNEITRHDDELDLVPEALKDLTVAMARAKQVGGGSGQSNIQNNCELGTA